MTHFTQQSIVRARKHGQYSVFVQGLESRMNWPVSKQRESPRRMIETMRMAAELIWLKGKPGPFYHEDWLREIVANWDTLSFSPVLPDTGRAGHLRILTEIIIHDLCDIAELVPETVAILDPLFEKLWFGLRNGSVWGMSYPSTLRCYMRICHNLGMISNPFLNHGKINGLRWILSNCYDDHGVPRYDVAAIDYWRITSGIALIDIAHGLQGSMTSTELRRYKAFESLPARLIINRKHPRIPGILRDHELYGGPLWSHKFNDAKSKYIRWLIRQQLYGGQPYQYSLRDLCAAHVDDSDSRFEGGYVPVACKGNRDFGEWKTGDGGEKYFVGRFYIRENKFTYVSDSSPLGEPINGSHRFKGQMPYTMSVI